MYIDIKKVIMFLVVILAVLMVVGTFVNLKMHENSRDMGLPGIRERFEKYR